MTKVSAMAIEGWIVSVVGTIMGCMVAMIAIYYGHKKDMLIIEKGLYKRMPVAQKTLMAGLILVGIGAALFIGIYWGTGLSTWLIAGLVPGFTGIALLISYLFIKKKR